MLGLLLLAARLAHLTQVREQILRLVEVMVVAAVPGGATCAPARGLGMELGRGGGQVPGGILPRPPALVASWI